MNWERRKQSEKWVREKSNEFFKTNSDLTFAEWCYQQGKSDAFKLIKENYEQLKSAYRMNGHNFDTDMWLDDLLTEQLKEQKNEN